MQALTITISGPRGAGKTTLAMLLAKCLEHYTTGEVLYDGKYLSNEAFDINMQDDSIDDISSDMSEHRRYLIVDKDETE